MNTKEISRIVYRLARKLNKKLDQKEVLRIVHEAFTLNRDELEKYFSDLKGEVTYSDDEGTQYLSITGLIKKEWLDTYYGKDEDLKRIEKQLSSGYSGGPGLTFSRSTVTLKPKGKDLIKFSITIHSGLDI